MTDHSKWVPIGFGVSAGGDAWVDWVELAGIPFNEAFLDDTVSNWFQEAFNPQVFRTTADALRILDGFPALDPRGIIFHLPRSGSTLLGNLLRQISGCVVISEPKVINDILLLDPTLIDRNIHVELLRLAARALGRRRLGEEKNLVLKLTSWNVQKASLFFEAFPDAKVLWLQRNPHDILRSIQREMPSWKSLRENSIELRALFGKSVDSLASLDDIHFCARVIGILMETAAQTSQFDGSIFDYNELPELGWTSVLSKFNLHADFNEIDRMRFNANLDSKAKDRRAYVINRPIDRTTELVSIKMEQLYNITTTGRLKNQRF